MRYSIYFFGLLLTNLAFADLSGLWQGGGRYYKGDKVVECESVIGAIAHAPEYFELSAAQIRCGTGVKEYPTIRLNIAAGQLFRGVKKVGQVTDSDMYAEFSLGEEEHTVYFIRNDMGGLQVTHQVWGEEGEMYVFEATLYPMNIGPVGFGVTRLECESFINKLDVTFTIAGDAFLTWTNKLSPGVDPFSRNAARKDSDEYTSLRFEDGELRIDASLMQEEVLSGSARAWFMSGRVENYNCIRR